MYGRGVIALSHAPTEREVDGTNPVLVDMKPVLFMRQGLTGSDEGEYQAAEAGRSVEGSEGGRVARVIGMNPGLLKPKGWARTPDSSTESMDQALLKADNFQIAPTSNQEEIRFRVLAHPMNETCKRVEASAEQGDLQWVFSLK